MTDRPLPQPSLHDQRERTVAILCDHFAQDRLDMHDFEARLDLANRAATRAELEAILQDLPATQAEAVPAPTQDAVARGSRAVREAVRDSRTIIAIMSGVERSGHWTPGRRNVVFAFMGGAELDFRDVTLPPGETEVWLMCMMGGAGIIVPPDLAVDANGIAIMGAFAHSATPVAVSPDAPVLKVHGICIMGGAEIEVRERGESAKEAAQRRKGEEKARIARRRARGEE